jgi:hypothetical protein
MIRLQVALENWNCSKANENFSDDEAGEGLPVKYLLVRFPVSRHDRLGMPHPNFSQHVPIQHLGYLSLSSDL